jgi:hypothetical protein
VNPIEVVWKLGSAYCRCRSEFSWHFCW